MVINNIEINKRKIGAGQPPYIIAELSANHNGDIQKALDTITAAQRCGADAIKMQTYTADTMTIDHDSSDFMIEGGLWHGYKLYDLYRWAETPFEWHKTLFDHARSLGITAFSTPFDETAVDLLEDLNVPAYKIASFEATDLPLIRYVASTRKPMIISTGMADLTEIEDAVYTARENGCEQLVLLHCISSYPAPIEQSNLLTIPEIRHRFSTVTGLSDHTISNTASIAAVALGASVIEKHFILDRNDEGPDSAFSIEPDDLTALCKDAKDVWASLGVAGFERKAAEIENIKFRRSVYFVKNIQAGETITEAHVRRIRPGFGLAPKYHADIIGKAVNQDVNFGTPVNRDMINNG